MLIKHMKKTIAIAIASLTIGVLAITPAKGDDSTIAALLAKIAQYTYSTALSSFYIEQYIYNFLLVFNGWILPDQSQATANLQASFAKQANATVNNFTTQQNLLQTLLPNFYGNSVTSDNIPYANDMTFGSLIGKPLYNKEPRKNGANSALNYITNVAGLNITHLAPYTGWKGTALDKKKYQDFYTTVSSIQSYDAYVLSQLYADNVTAKNVPRYSEVQNALIQQASSSDWFSEVASENMGSVIRQMLMYNSQIYVLLTQLIQTQKQMLATLAMTNTLIVIGDSFTENQLVQKAAMGGP